MTLLLYTLPWLGVFVFVRFIKRVPTELSPVDTVDPGSLPGVSVIVPARNEALNIETCLTSLSRSTYPDFEVVVVDDRSDDGTAVLAESVPKGNARRIRVVEGAELPEGWLGKPWACHQGAALARGDLLLFTDADTIHAPELLTRAVVAREEEGADLLTVAGRQLMETFWERLVQPQVFLVMLFRFPDFERTARNDRWRDAIANGQFMLFTREAYEALGGHEAVRGEVVEDLALAQHVKRAGLSLRIRGAVETLSTRMYRSLAHLVEGWSKNILIGGLQSVPAWLRPIVPLASFLAGVGLWIVPPIVLVAALAGLLGTTALVWSASVFLISSATFALFTHELKGPPAYGLLYWLGAAVGTYIFVRSWTRGRRVEWKGRRYTLDRIADRP